MTQCRVLQVRPTILRRIVATTLLLAAVLMAGPNTAFGQPPGNGFGEGALDPGWQFGFDMFQLMLEHRDLVTTEDFVGTLRDDPSKSVIVLVGDLSRLPDWTWPQIGTFIRRGGAVLIATDRQVDAKGLCVMAGGPVITSDSRVAYQRRYADCPRVTNVTPRTPLTVGIKELIVNRSGWVDRIARQSGDWTMLAYLPRSAMAYSGGGGGKPVAASMSLPGENPGRLLAVGDHSLFINGMLWHGDNAMFALNVSGWLAQGDRRKVLFLVNGIPTQPGIDPSSNPANMPDINPEDLPDIPKESYLAFANGFAAALEDSDVLNGLASSYPKEMESGKYWRCVFLALACLAGWILFRRFPTKGRAAEPPVRRPASSLLATRVKEQVESGNLRPAARELARDLFRELTGSDDPRSWSIDACDVKIDGSFLLKRNTRAALTRFRRLASNQERFPVSAKDLRGLVSRIEQIRRLYYEGRLAHPWFNPAADDAALSSSPLDSQRPWQSD